MKLLLYIGIFLAVILMPTEATDVGKLIPVEVVAISDSGGTVTINTDTGDSGIGDTLESAISDMKAAASGIIYLDTAEYLLLDEGMENHLNAVERHLKKEVRLCYAQENMPLETVADFLSVHKPNATLKTVSDNGIKETITEENGKYHLVENKSENLKFGIDK